MVDEDKHMEMRKWLIRRLPKALFEATLIILSVLVALGVDEYRESLAQRKLAETAVDRIIAETRDNRDQMLDARGENQALLVDLEQALAALDQNNNPEITGVNFEVSLLGDDAWDTARMTRAVHFMDFDRVSRISQVYRLQQLYLERQDQVVSDVASIGGRQRKLGEVFGAIRGGLAITLKLQCELLGEYDSLLGEMLSEQLDTTPSAPSVPSDCGD